MQIQEKKGQCFGFLPLTGGVKVIPNLGSDSLLKLFCEMFTDYLLKGAAVGNGSPPAVRRLHTEWQPLEWRKNPGLRTPGFTLGSDTCKPCNLKVFSRPVSPLVKSSKPKPTYFREEAG